MLICFSHIEHFPFIKGKLHFGQLILSILYKKTNYFLLVSNDFFILLYSLGYFVSVSFIFLIFNIVLFESSIGKVYSIISSILAFKSFSFYFFSFSSSAILDFKGKNKPLTLSAGISSSANMLRCATARDEAISNLFLFVLT